MPKSHLKEDSGQDFLDTVDDLNSVMHLFHVMKEIEGLLNQPDKTNSERITQLQADYESTRNKLRFTNFAAYDA